jgi:hypothetical protein
MYSYLKEEFISLEGESFVGVNFKETFYNALPQKKFKTFSSCNSKWPWGQYFLGIYEDGNSGITGYLGRLLVLFETQIHHLNWRS